MKIGFYTSTFNDRPLEEVRAACPEERRDDALNAILNDLAARFPTLAFM